MDDTGRSWTQEFKDYTEFIVKHKNYKGLTYERSVDGKVKWVVTGKSDAGKKRTEWWNNQCKRLKIPIQKGCYAIAARIIHPTKKHVCQCCGKELSILYEYPSKNLLKKINNTFNTSIEQTDYTIGELIDKCCKNAINTQKMAELLNISGITNKKDLKKRVYNELVAKQSSLFSPGVMSNCPDRYDGFHSDGLCCREKTDKGRNKDNMATYTQDRRAYEEWAGGNWNLANRLMGEFHKGSQKYRCPICGEIRTMSADHIGPISLGFCHSTHFAPMCKSCNSSKNNRFTKDDVSALINLEKEGEQVVSWHSQHIWDLLKMKIYNDEQAKKASHIMAIAHQTTLHLLAELYRSCGPEFLLRYLHPEYALYDYRFENFNPLELSTLVVKESPLDSKNKQKNMERYLRISFESLKEFASKYNRRQVWDTSSYTTQISNIIKKAKAEKYDEADAALKKLIAKIADDIFDQEWQ